MPDDFSYEDAAPVAPPVAPQLVPQIGAPSMEADPGKAWVPVARGKGVTVEVQQPIAAGAPQPPAQPAPSANDDFSYEDAAPTPGAPPQGLRPDNGLGFYQGIMKPLDNAAQGLEWLAGKAGLPVQAIDQATGGSAADAAGQHQAFIDAQATNGSRPGGLGRFAGEVVGTIPFTLGMGPLATGAASGALLSDAKTPGGLAFDAGVGAAGGKVAHAALGALKNVLVPQVGDAARTLLGEGIRLTPGQILGGGAQRIEDGLTSIPMLGDIINNAKARSLTDFNRAAINRALTPLGQQLPDNLAAGNDAVDFAHQTLSDAYDAVTPHLTARLDPQFASDVGNLKGLAQNLTPDYASKFNNILQNEVLNRFAPQTGVMTGQSLKEAEAQLGNAARKFGRIQDGHAQDYADAVRELQAQVRGLVQRQNPQFADQLSRINEGYANLVRVENAASRLNAKGGVFTPAQLHGAVRATDNSVRKTATARGNALMQDLSSAGREVLPSSVPDSGSPYRHALEAIVALLVGKEANALPLLAKGAVAGATIGAPYTKIGQKVVTPLLTVRPPQLSAAADLLPQLKTPAMQMGSAAAITARQAGSN